MLLLAQLTFQMSPLLQKCLCVLIGIFLLVKSKSPLCWQMAVNWLVLGEIEVNLRVGQRVFPQSVVVADLGGEGAILGLDFMRKHRAVLCSYTGQMNLGRETVQLYGERGPQRCGRVSLGGSVTIQPCSVKVVEVGREMLVSHVTVPEMSAVESLTSLTDRTGLLAMGGVAVVRDEKVPMSIINVHDEPIDL